MSKDEIVLFNRNFGMPNGECPNYSPITYHLSQKRLQLGYNPPAPPIIKTRMVANTKKRGYCRVYRQKPCDRAGGYKLKAPMVLAQKVGSMRKFESTNPRGNVGYGHLVYYIIVTGKDKVGAGWMYFRNEHEFETWKQAIPCEQVLAVQHKGINFSVFDQLPYCKNTMYAQMFDAVLEAEGLI